MADPYNRAGAGYLSRPTPVAIDALRIMIDVMDEAYIAALLNPSLEPYYRLCQAQVILVARVLAL